MLLFTGFLSLQIIFDILSAEGTEGAKHDRYVHYEEQLKNTVFQSLEGTEYRYEDIMAPVIVLNFWASWCVPCLEEFPSLVELQKRYPPEQILVLGINSGDDSPKDIKKTVEKYGLNFPVIPNVGGALLQRFQVVSLPNSIIFHRGGTVEATLGAQDFVSGEMIEKFNTLLAK